MSAGTPPGYEPTWARRISGWSLLLFFLTLGILTTITVYFNNANDLEDAANFAALASTVPLLAILIPYYSRPVWSIQVPSSEDTVANTVRAVLGNRGPRPLSERKGPFVRCTSVLVLKRPPCAVGWYHTRPPPESVAISPRSVVILAARKRDRNALAELRESLRSALSQSMRSS